MGYCMEEIAREKALVVDCFEASFVDMIDDGLTLERFARIAGTRADRVKVYWRDDGCQTFEAPMVPGGPVKIFATGTPAQRKREEP